MDLMRQTSRIILIDLQLQSKLFDWFLILHDLGQGKSCLKFQFLIVLIEI